MEDEKIMRNFTEEVTVKYKKDSQVLRQNWESLFIGWCLANNISLEKAIRIHNKLRHIHNYEYQEKISKINKQK